MTTHAINWSCTHELEVQARTLLEAKARRVHGLRFKPTFVDETFRSKVEAPIALLRARRTHWLAKQHFPGRESPALLDIGCGFGTFVLASLGLGLDARGVDMAEGEISFARNRLQETIPDHGDDRYITQRGEALPFADEQFQIVSLWMVVEHIPRWKEALAEAHRVLAPSGLLLISTPNYLATWKEPHFHIPWTPAFALLPKGLVGRYIRWLGLGGEYFDQELALVHTFNLGRFLKKLEYDVSYGHRLLFETAPKREEVEPEPTRAITVAASLARTAKRLHVSSLLTGLVGCSAWSPFARSVTFYARKKG